MGYQWIGFCRCEGTRKCKRVLEVSAAGGHNALLFKEATAPTTR